MPEGADNGPKPTVSVVIPAYNGERFIGDAIRSVLDQTFGDFELIVIDDGSTDGTVEVVRSFDDRRIHVHSKENGGESSARNAGWRRARADLVAFLDQDDLWVPDRLKTQLEIMRDPGVVLAGSLMRYESLGGRLLGIRGRVLDAEGQQRYAEGQIRQHPFETSAWLVRKSALEETGGFDESFQVAGSAELLMRIARLGRIEGPSRPLSVHRLHGRSQVGRRPRLVAEELWYIEARMAARNRGDDLTWEEFRRSHRPDRRTRRLYFSYFWFRQAAAALGDRRFLPFIGYSVRFFANSPIRAVRKLRLRKRRLRRFADS
ncbi:MAG: glycosyltransferase family 2 protein [Actinomycetota bacterium]